MVALSDRRKTLRYATILSATPVNGLSEKDRTLLPLIAARGISDVPYL